MIYRASNIAVPHGFFDSNGGVSDGKYSSLNTNINSHDKIQNVMKNFEIIANNFKVNKKNMVTIRQSVSNLAVYVDHPSWFEIKADGMVTKNRDLLLGIKTADCAPVFFADEKNEVIGAAHAGWRGAIGGIIENVVFLMQQHGAEIDHISAAIGPCLQKKSFAAKEDMRQIFLSALQSNDQYFETVASGEYLFDLNAYLEDKIRRLGIENVTSLKIDTYPPENHFFSYRRDMHQKLITVPLDYPTQYSCIKLRK